MSLELLKTYALSFIGVRYLQSLETGGDDPIAGFDCSGLVCELLRAAGVVPFNWRTNAQGIYNHFRTRGHASSPALGALVFYGKSATEITHIGFCLDDTTMIEAGGGGPTTQTEKEAAIRNAFVRLRPIRFRRDYLCALYPRY